MNSLAHSRADWDPGKTRHLEQATPTVQPDSSRTLLANLISRVGEFCKDLSRGPFSAPSQEAPLCPEDRLKEILCTGGTPIRPDPSIRQRFAHSQLQVPLAPSQPEPLMSNLELAAKERTLGKVFR